MSANSQEYSIKVCVLGEEDSGKRVLAYALVTGKNIAADNAQTFLSRLNSAYDYMNFSHNGYRLAFDVPDPRRIGKIEAFPSGRSAYINVIDLSAVTTVAELEEKIRKLALNFDDSDHCLCVATKADKARSDVLNYLKESQSDVIITSAVTGEGVDVLRKTLQDKLIPLHKEKYGPSEGEQIFNAFQQKSAEHQSSTKKPSIAIRLFGNNKKPEHLPSFDCYEAVSAYANKQPNSTVAKIFNDASNAVRSGISLKK